MKKIVTTLCALLFVMQSASAWNRSIHAGIAAIAHDNLTEQTKAAIADILDGRSIVHSASRPATNHELIAFNAKGKMITPKKAAKSKNAEVKAALLMQDIEGAIAALKDPQTPKDVKAAMLKSLVIAIGDLNCPGHYIYTDALKYRDIVFFHTKDPKERKYTEFWESAAVQGTFGWLTNEFVHQLSRKSAEQVAQITAGSVTDWAASNAAAYRPLYKAIENNHHFEQGIDYRLWLNTIYPTAVEQVAVAGYRLAALLNSIF